MIVDSSAILAILLGEPEAADFAAAMVGVRPLRISAATWLEAAINSDNRRSRSLPGGLDAIIERLGIEIVPVSAAQASIARTAHQQYGRGQHPARLNYGDCFAYALSKESGEPLLFKGDDFSLTDITSVLKPTSHA